MEMVRIRSGTPQPAVTPCRPSITKPPSERGLLGDPSRVPQGEAPAAALGLKLPSITALLGGRSLKGAVAVRRLSPLPSSPAVPPTSFARPSHSLPMLACCQGAGKGWDKERALRARLPVWLAASR